MMSEIDNSTLVESAMEMQPLEQEPTLTAEATPETSVVVPVVSNQEAMTALVLSRVKKQSKQIDRLGKLVSQIPVQLKNIERGQSKQAKVASQQVRSLQSQVKQLQKQVARLKIARAPAAKKKASKKAKKIKARRR